MNVFRKRLRVLFLEIRKALSRLNGYFAEQIHGMQVLQHDGGEARSRANFRSQAHRYTDQYRRANWLDAGLYAIMDGMSSVAVGMLLASGAWLMGIDTSITLGLLVAFIEYVTKVFIPIREFSSRFATLQRAVAALERVFGLLDTHEEIGGGDLDVPAGPLPLSFDTVSFAYSDDRPDVLKGVSFDVAPGEVLAIVGATGSGKSTIAKLLLRMYDGYRGNISLGGAEIRQLSTVDARKRIAVVHQDPYLFEGTIHENISLWSDVVDSSAVAEAAKVAHIDTFAPPGDDGYTQPVQERGGICRLANVNWSVSLVPSPVLLRSSSSTRPPRASTPSRSRRSMMRSVHSSSRTVIVIAHRISTIAKADRILVMHQGPSSNMTHEEPLAPDGHYALQEWAFRLDVNALQALSRSHAGPPPIAMHRPRSHVCVRLPGPRADKGTWRRTSGSASGLLYGRVTRCSGPQSEREGSSKGPRRAPACSMR